MNWSEKESEREKETKREMCFMLLLNFDGKNLLNEIEKMISVYCLFGAANSEGLYYLSASISLFFSIYFSLPVGPVYFG